MISPAQSDYAEAVQNPSISFSDRELQASTPALSQFQTPQASSGGFAIAFCLQGANESWAVRCFTHDASGLTERYAAISRYLGSPAPDPFVSIRFIPDGIRVNSGWWPITVMPWVQGSDLNDWIQAHLGDISALSELRSQIQRVAAEMERRSIAHGDLQHGNILVRGNGTMVLIDYDGMYVPQLAGKPMPERGHVNYQHPQRSGATFGPGLDRFSLAVIYSALEIVESMPELWHEFDNGENLLFRASDFADPSSSRLLEAIRGDSRTAGIAERISRLAQAPVDAVPSLLEVMAGNLPAAAPVSSRPNKSPFTQYQVVDMRRGDIDLYEGDRVTVVGEIKDYIEGQTRRADPFAFVVLGSTGATRIKVVAWSEVLGPLGWSSRRPGRGRLAAVTGLVTRYQGQLQIELERAALFEDLTGARAQALVGTPWKSAPTSRQRLTHPRLGDVVRHDLWGNGEITKTRNDIVTVRFAVGFKVIQFTTFDLELVSRGPIGGTKRRRPVGVTAAPAPTRATGPTPLGGPSAPGQPKQGKLSPLIQRSEAQALNSLFGSVSPTSAKTPSTGAGQRSAGGPMAPAQRPPGAPSSAPSPTPRSAAPKGLGSRVVDWRSTALISVAGAVLGFAISAEPGALLGAIGGVGIALVAANW